MKKALKIILLISGIIIVILVLLYYLVMRGVAPVDIPDARTLYTGFVQIEYISLSEIKTRLENIGCRLNDYQGETESRCKYRETTVHFDKQNGIEIYPHGFGWGPLSFYLTEEKLWATKDIPGSPNPAKFKEEVRQDVQDIDNIIQIKEYSWKITETKYPWTVIY